jgi:hypothetical protein
MACESRPNGRSIEPLRRQLRWRTPRREHSLGQEENTADQPPRLCASAEPNPPSGGTSSSSARPRPAALKAAVYVSRLCVGAVGSAGTGEHP